MPQGPGTYGSKRGRPPKKSEESGFKMRGNPMQRNFGIGSPTKTKITDHPSADGKLHNELHDEGFFKKNPNKHSHDVYRSTPKKKEKKTSPKTITPAKHTQNRADHMETYGKGHTNEAHPNYWKKAKETTHTSTKGWSDKMHEVNRDDDSEYQYVSDPDDKSTTPKGKYGKKGTHGYEKITYGPKRVKKTPAKHSTNRTLHTEKYGKSHTNKAHPDYWKKKQESSGIYSEKESDQFHEYHGPKRKVDPTGTGLTELDPFHVVKEERENNPKDHIGKVAYESEIPEYKETFKGKSKSKSKSKSKKGKLPSYEASYTASVADKWKDKGGKAAYIKAAKAWNARKRK